MASLSTPTIQVAWFTGLLLLRQAAGCDGQLTHGTMYGGGVGPGFGMAHIPTSGMYGTPYTRPTYTQGYGYSYANSQMRTAAQDTSEEALDNAQRAAMEPLNNVISSLPVRPDMMPLLPFNIASYLPTSQGRDASQDVSSTPQRSCGGPDGKCAEGKSTSESASSSNSKTETPTEKQHQEQAAHQEAPAADRQLPSGSHCICPCSYYGWLYSGFPFYDYTHPNYPKSSVSPSAYIYDYTHSNYPKTSASPSAYTYSYPYSYNSDKPTSQRSARTFWLPWANPAAPTIQNPLGRPGYSYAAPVYNRMYYGRRY